MQVNDLDIQIESPLEALELQDIAESIMLRGKIPWDHSFIALWVEQNKLSDTQRLLMVSSVLPQRILLATTKYWREHLKMAYKICKTAVMH